MTATLPPHSTVRDCRLYRIRVYHPDDMGLPAEQRRIVLGYVGETLRQPLVRLMEHITDQPWSDTIVGWELDPRVFAGKDAVLAAEAAAIRAERPLYNVRGNEFNADRITPPVAIKQRRSRDARQGAVRWVHPNDRAGAVSNPRPAPRGTAKRRRPGFTGGWLVAAWVCAWLMLAAMAGRVAFAHAGTTRSAVIWSLVAPTLLCLYGMALGSKTWRWLKRKLR